MDDFVTAFIRTTAKTTAKLFIRDGSTVSYMTVYDETPFAKRELVFTATKETMELGFTLVGETNAFKFACIDDILVERVVEQTCDVTVSLPTVADHKYTGRVTLTVNGKEEREVCLKVYFANPTGKLANVPVTLNGETYATVPFYKTETTASASANVTCFPILFQNDVNTVTLDTGDTGLYIYKVEVVHKLQNRF